MVSSLDKLYEDSGFAVVDSEIESGKGEFVEALEDPTCLLQWKEISQRGEERTRMHSHGKLRASRPPRVSSAPSRP